MPDAGIGAAESAVNIKAISIATRRCDGAKRVTTRCASFIFRATYGAVDIAAIRANASSRRSAPSFNFILKHIAADARCAC